MRSASDYLKMVCRNSEESLFQAIFLKNHVASKKEAQHKEKTIQKDGFFFGCKSMIYYLNMMSCRRKLSIHLYFWKMIQKIYLRCTTGHSWTVSLMKSASLEKYHRATFPKRKSILFWKTTLGLQKRVNIFPKCYRESFWARNQKTLQVYSLQGFFCIFLLCINFPQNDCISGEYFWVKSVGHSRISLWSGL